MTTALQPHALRRGWGCGPAQPGDARAIRRLLGQAMPGRVAIATPHEPDHRHAMRIAGEPTHEVVVRDPDHADAVIGYGYRAVQQLMINGKPRRVGYLGGLRCDASLRAAIKVLGRCFDHLADTRTPDQAPYDLTSVMAENAVIRRALEKGLPGLPAYIPIGRMVTLTLRTGRARRGTKPQPAAVADRAATQAIYAEHAACFNARPMRIPDKQVPHRGTPASEVATHLITAAARRRAGCLTLWDQRAVRQIVVSGYAPALRRARPVINLGLSLAGRPTLPRPGGRLEMAYASHAGFALDDAETAAALLDGARALAASRAIPLLSIGLPAEAPLLKPLIKRFRPWVTRSLIYAVTTEPGAIDFDARPIWMEVATL